MTQQLVTAFAHLSAVNRLGLEGFSDVELDLYSQPEQQLVDYEQATGLKPLIIHDDDGNQIGIILDCLERGFEAFDGGYAPIAVFKNNDAAVNAIRANGGDPEPTLKPNAASDIGTRTVTVTFFLNKSAQSQRYADLTLPQLAEQILTKTGPDKLALPWLKLAIFGDKRSAKGCLRTNANMVHITGIEVEHDSGKIAFDEAIMVVRKAGIRALLYTSPSYVPAAKERWRILLPLSSSLPPELREKLVARVNGLFGGKLAGESFTLSQAYLYGRVNDNHAHRVEVIDGDFIDLRTNLDPGAIGKGGDKPAPEPAAKPKPVKNPLAGGIEDYPPVPFEPAIKKGCAWLREAYETGGKDFDNPQWHLMILIVTFLKDGHKLAHKLGDKYPGYTPEETNEKWDEKIRARADNPKLGWPSCKTIDAAQRPGPSLCQQCPWFSNGKSPLNLAPPAAPPPITDELLEELGGTRPDELRLPEHFCIDEKWQLCHIHRAPAKPGKLGMWVKTQLISNRISAPSLQFQNGHFGIGFTVSTDKTNTTEVFLTSAECYPAPGLIKCLAEKMVMSNPDEGAAAMVQKFFVGWFDKLKSEDVAIRDQGTLGWRYDDNGKMVGFVYGDVLYHEDGSETPIVASTDEEFRSHYMPTGTREAWVEAAKLLTDRKRPELDIIISSGFAAALMAFFRTLYGAILSVWGEPGSSKSTAQMVAAAVWGSPKQTRESLNSTPKSVQGRLGRTKNLAAFWDDIQDERHQDRLFETMFVATQGAEGGRLNTDASMKKRLEWHTMLVACANGSFVEFLIKKQKSTTAGMRRVLEFEFKYDKEAKADEPGIINAVEADQIFGALEHNFGRIGAEYAKILATEHAAIGIMVDEITKEFMEAVDGEGDENYWWGMCGALLTGATLANRLGAEIDVPAMQAFLIEAYRSNRKIRGGEGTEGGSLANTEQSLASFLNQYANAGNVLYVARAFEHRTIPVDTIGFPEKGKRILIQIARDERKIWISKPELREHFRKHEIQGRQVYDGLKKFFGATEVQRTLGAGTPNPQTKEWCFEIPVHGDQGMLYDLLIARGMPESDVPTS